MNNFFGNDLANRILQSHFSAVSNESTRLGFDNGQDCFSALGQDQHSRSVARDPFFPKMGFGQAHGIFSALATGHQEDIRGVYMGATSCAIADGSRNHSHLTDFGGHRRVRPGLVPSYVAFETGDGDFGATPAQTLVGESAKKFAPKEYSVYGMKRIIGKPFNDPDVERSQNYWLFDVKPSSTNQNMPAVMVPEAGGTSYKTPIDITAILLSELTKGTGMSPSRAKKIVMAVPGKFKTEQLEATIHACQEAGLEVIGMIEENSAVAVSYLLHGVKNQTFMICHFGREALEISVFQHTDTGGLRVLCQHVDETVGGRELEDRLLNYCIEEFRKLTGLDVNQHGKALRRLAVECEQIKTMLVEKKGEHILSLSQFIGEEDFHLAVPPAGYYRLCGEVFDNLGKAIQVAVKKANRNVSEFHFVSLTGFYTRIPRVAEIVASVFGRTKLKTDKTEFGCDVALGAAEYGCSGINLNRQGQRTPFDSLLNMDYIKISTANPSTDVATLAPVTSSNYLPTTARYNGKQLNMLLADEDHKVMDKIQNSFMASMSSIPAKESATPTPSGCNVVPDTTVTHYPLREIPSDDIKVMDQIGSSNCFVYKAKWSFGDCAVKIIRNDKANSVFKEEATIHCNLAHPNIVKFFGLAKGPFDTLIVMEFIQGSTLYETILRDEEMTKTDRIILATEICAAIYYLHSRTPTSIIHHDIKSANIMVRGIGNTSHKQPRTSSSLQAVLLDFGLSRMSRGESARKSDEHPTENPSLFHGLYGTTEYMAPEQLIEQGSQMYSKGTIASDIYSLGGTLVELLSGQLLQRYIWQQYSQVTGCSKPPYLTFLLEQKSRGSEIFPVHHISDEYGSLRDTVRRCLSREIISRPTAKEVAEQVERYLLEQQQRRVAGRNSRPSRGRNYSL